jgi:erythromycin esterase-like protein
METPHISRSESVYINQIQKHAHPLTTTDDLQPLLNRVGDARIVMLGEASHGTHEYYTWRSRISKLLIEEHGFNFIAVEGDWPDCYHLNRFIKGYENSSSDASDVLKEFGRWPSWMWANWEIAALSEWLRKHNKTKAPEKRVGFYGLDVYSLWESMDSIMNYLEKVDTAALKLARDAFRCFEPYRKDEGQSYARASRFVPNQCREEVVSLLGELRNKLPQYNTDHESSFSVEQNAHVAVNAERYYRAMLEGGAATWNLRDRHMADTLERLLNLHGKDAKAIVWAHNTHIGDARATDMAAEGMFNIGELARKEYPEKDVVLVGFGSYKGAVIAGASWGDPLQIMPVPEARKGSWEYLLHNAGSGNKLLIMDDFKKGLLGQAEVGHRAIGVVYRPQFEQYGNYVPSVVAQRYDAFIYLDETRALHPLQVHHENKGMPDTYPFGT